MCILLTTTHSCAHTLRSAIPCGSNSLACGFTFQSAIKYYSCEDCQFNLALALKAKHSRINHQYRPKATRGYHDDSIGTSVEDSRAGDFLSALRIGSQEPSMGWGNLERTRARREEIETLERTNPNYLADRRASSSSLSSLGSTVSTPSAFADTVPQDRRESTSSLSSLGSYVSTPSAFADSSPEPQNRRSNARRSSGARDPTPADDSPGSDDDRPSVPTCPRHTRRAQGYGSARCTECEGLRSGTEVVHLKPAGVVEDWTRADMKSRPSWRGWVPVTSVPAGEFQQFPKFDRRGVPIVNSTDEPLSRGRGKRRRIGGGKEAA